MHITGIELQVLRIPLKRPFTRSKKIGTLVDCTPIVCKIHTDTGHVGIGETNPVMPLTCEDATIVIHVIKEHLAPALLGQDPLNIAEIYQKMDNATTGWSVPKAGIELACYDLLGKVGNLRVADMLGGVLNTKLPILWAVGMDSPEANASEALAMKNKGFTALMIKVAAGTLQEDARRIYAIREALGDEYPLIIDANQGWDLASTLRFAKMIESCNIELV